MYNEWSVYIRIYSQLSTDTLVLARISCRSWARTLHKEGFIRISGIQLLQLHVNASPTYNGRSHDDFVHYANDSDDQRDNAICG